MWPRRSGDIEPIDRVACLRYLAEASVGRLAFVHDGRTTILPVNHVVHDGALYFRTAPGGKLGAAADGTDVAFEVDGDLDRSGGWSVVIHGHARIVTDADVAEALHNLPFSPWVEPDERMFWVEVALEEVSGRRIR